MTRAALALAALGGCSSATPPNAPDAPAAGGSAGTSTALPSEASGNGGGTATGGVSSDLGVVSGASGSAAASSAGSTTGGLGLDPGAGEPLDPSACTPGTGNLVYVSPQGTSEGDGKSFSTALDLVTATAIAEPGDTLLLEPGKYSVPYVADAKNTIALSRQGTADSRIRIIPQGGRAEIDFSFPEQAWVQDSYGFLVSGSYWSLCRLDITRAGYQGAYVTGQHNTFENCSFHDNRNTGLEINKGGAFTSVINCDAYRNYDPKKRGGMADGFGPKETQGPGNRFYGCRAWENSDDGYDAYNSPEPVIFERSFAFRNGIDVWGYPDYAGNGNGFKLGGLSRLANHRLTQCAAFANRVKGFDQNNNTGGLTIYNSIAFDNGINFGLGGPLNAGQQHDLRNNVSLGAMNSISNALERNNSWNLSAKVAVTDFKDLEVAHGSTARGPDGSLPADDFLRLTAGSALIDAGVDVGLPFNGRAPDLGAYEAP